MQLFSNFAFYMTEPFIYLLFSLITMRLLCLLIDIAHILKGTLTELTLRFWPDDATYNRDLTTLRAAS